MVGMVASDKQLNHQAVIDGLGQGVLIFDSGDHLVLDNLAARTILGTDLKLIRAEGWKAASTLFNTRLNNPDEAVENVRSTALTSGRPVRFHIYRSGEYVPCWAAAVQGDGGEIFTMITIEVPDWSAIHELMDKFREEVQTAAEATQGHTDLIMQTVKNVKPKDTVETLGKRITGFTQLISTHMHRLERMTKMLERLEYIRTGKIQEIVRANRKKLALADFIEDFLEELAETKLLDPETANQDYRSRITTTIPSDLVIEASVEHLSAVLQDLLRNAIMYTMKASPIMIIAHSTGKNQSVQVDVIDEGYGVRTKEFERVFLPFQRARQPQIIGEFGYGLSLYLCKHEIEAMNGKIWFESEEGVGSTFSFKLPAWREDTADGQSASKVTTETAEATKMQPAGTVETTKVELETSPEKAKTVETKSTSTSETVKASSSSQSET
jgi:signal transduction histidine kinase